MNRAEMTRRVLLLEAAAAELKTRAKVYRDGLEGQARDEYATQGMRVAWTLPEVGTWTLPLSQQAVYVSNETALLEWVKAEGGDLSEVVETIERVKPAYVGELLRLVQVIDGQIIDDLGTIVPGLAVRAGGTPQTMQFRADPLAKVVAAQSAGKLIDEIAAGLGIETPDAAG